MDERRWAVCVGAVWPHLPTCSDCSYNRRSNSPLFTIRHTARTIAGLAHSLNSYLVLAFFILPLFCPPIRPSTTHQLRTGITSRSSPHPICLSMYVLPLDACLLRWSSLPHSTSQSSLPSHLVV